MSRQPKLGESPTRTPRESVNAWLRARVRTEAGQVPDLMSPAWLQLPDNHPLKVAAVCQAALAWVRHTDPETVRNDLLDEIEAADWARRQLLAEEYARSVRIVTATPNRAEIMRRRGATAKRSQPAQTEPAA